ncbi:MAG: hypothetical protein JRN06_02855 [Nitrososphaerota archaeon]|nr:hypothetical protein [Nitrososphaerota archaeon]MDG7023203.1 hypothetical protein [Nitrososphaerota archaeon]
MSEIFGKVERHKPVEGFSGIKWRVDFLAGSNFVVEVSVQKRLETKIDSTFLRFVDITRKHQDIKAALVFEDLYVGHHRSLDKKFFPTSGYRTMIQHGFPILTPKEIPRLTEFRRGATTALEVSARPNDFHMRSLHANRMEVGKEILRVLASGPLTRREIAEATGRNPFYVVVVIRTLPQVKKLGGYYALSEESILKRLTAKKGRLRSPIQKRLVADFLRRRFIQVLDEKGRCKTKELAGELGLHPRSLSQLTHQLTREGVIQKLGNGEWGKVTPGRQEALY